MAQLLRREKLGIAVGIAIGIVAMLIVLAVARNGGGSGGGGGSDSIYDPICVQREMERRDATNLDKHSPDYKYALMIARSACISP
jgi:hypothetical protein